jgi:putative antitoxin of VapBC-like toxin-antitoxin system
MRTTLVIDDDVLEEARQMAAADGRSVGAVISALARRSLAPVTITHRSGFPIFDVPTDAPRITTEDVSRALDDE